MITKKNMIYSRVSFGEAGAMGVGEEVQGNSAGKEVGAPDQGA